MFSLVLGAVLGTVLWKEWKLWVFHFCMPQKWHRYFSHRAVRKISCSPSVANEDIGHVDGASRRLLGFSVG